MKLFFSWQSDLPDEKKFIRKQLQDICDDLDIEYDEDTRDTGSAEFVTDILLRKIKNSSVFIADLTPVGRTENNKALANPNVCFELGFAECHLGRSRIIITYNESLATFDDLPFDLSKRNSVRFKIPNTSSDKSIYKKQLKKAVEDALKAHENSKQIPLHDDKPLNKYEKTLLFWGMKKGGGLISDARANSENKGTVSNIMDLSIGNNGPFSSTSTFFYSRHKSREKALFRKAIDTLLTRSYITVARDEETNDIFLSGMTAGKMWAITGEGETIADTLKEDEVYQLVNIQD